MERPNRTTHKKLRVLLPLIVVAGSLWQCSASARAEGRTPAVKSPARQGMVTVQVNDSDGARRQTTRFVLPISDRGPGRVRTQIDGLNYELSVVSVPGDGLVFRLDRAGREPEKDLHLDVTLKMDRGNTATVSRTERPDRSRTEVTAQLR